MCQSLIPYIAHQLGSFQGTIVKKYWNSGWNKCEDWTFLAVCYYETAIICKIFSREEVTDFFFFIKRLVSYIKIQFWSPRSGTKIRSPIIYTWVNAAFVSWGHPHPNNLWWKLILCVLSSASQHPVRELTHTAHSIETCFLFCLLQAWESWR